jgi:hypothetical protein
MYFDTPTAKEDPRVNICDFYLFRGRPGTTVMALTVNPNAGVGAPDTFRDEGLYAFRFDTDRDLREDVSKPIRDFVEKVTALAHSAADPSAYATQLLARLCPAVLPYELDTPASFSFAAFNGRGLSDDVMDVILTPVTNTALGDGVAPDMRDYSLSLDLGTLRKNLRESNSR